MKRSNTSGIANKLMGAGQSMEVSVRAIDNGFIVRESNCDAEKGIYETRERFSETKPTVGTKEVEVGKKMENGGSLHDAIKLLG